MKAMKRFLVSLSILLIYLSIKVDCMEKDQQHPKAKVTRTALHVARSLDPDAMETLIVKTKTGEVATLLVKKREGRHQYHDQINKTISNSINKDEPSNDMIQIASSSHTDEPISLSQSSIYKRPEESERVSKNVPEPVFIRSDMVFVKGQKNDLFSNKRSRTLLKLDSDGIPEVTGVRMPDDDSDRHVWRNARVINGILTPYEKSGPKHSSTNSDSVLLSYQQNKKKIPTSYSSEGQQWLRQRTETIPKYAGIIQEPLLQSTINAASSTVPAQQSNTFETDWKPTVPSKPQDNVSIIESQIVQEMHQYPEEVVKVIDDTQPILKEEDKYLRDKILEYIKNVNKQELMKYENMKQENRLAKSINFPSDQESRSSGYPIQVDMTRSYEPMEARNLDYDTFEVQESRIIDHPIEYNPSNYRQEPIIIGYESVNYNPLPQPQALRMESRMLQVPGETVYPTSLLYSSQRSHQPSPVEEGVRTPVLQYAHPELGVQPADVQKSRVVTDEKVPQVSNQEQGIQYYVRDIHDDRSPFAFEPSMEDEDIKTNENSQRSHNDKGSVKPKKYTSQPDIYQNTHGNNNKYYGKYEFIQPANNVYQENYSRPFWERISNTIKEQVQTHMDRVSEMTRPVVEPLVEATQKISHNLGLDQNKEIETIKEKMGVVNTPSVILPALGLVAGGAALGLGAVAVGRYLDVDMLKRSGGDAAMVEEDQLEMEHKRAMNAVGDLPIKYEQVESSKLQDDPNQTQLKQSSSILLREDPSHPNPQIGKSSSLSSTNQNNTKDIDSSTTKLNQSEEVSSKSESSERVRRDVHDEESNDILSSMVVNQRLNQFSDPSLWNDTPCAKKTFCDAMLFHKDDDVIVMEKKMMSYLSMLNIASRQGVSSHLDDVMQAIKNRDCSVFHCIQYNTDTSVPR